jgi:solute:Na+ symporter, SSS family
MQHLGLGPTDLLIIALHFVFVLGIGLVLKRSMKRSEDFLLSGRRIPPWIAGLAQLSFGAVILIFVLISRKRGNT